MTPNEIIVAGQLLYGPHWQCALARNVGVTDRSVRRWVKGKSKIKPATEEKIKILMARHANFMRIILSNLESNKPEKFLHIGLK